MDAGKPGGFALRFQFQNCQKFNLVAHGRNFGFLDSFHLFTLHFDQNGSTFSSWVNGGPQNVEIAIFMNCRKQRPLGIARPATIGGGMAEVMFVREIGENIRRKIEVI